MFNRGSTPAIFKIDNDKVGFCYAVHNHSKVPVEFCPKPPLTIDMVKDMDWECTTNKISLIVIPTLVPLPLKRLRTPSLTMTLLKKCNKS
jgi:hypothetical protein